jgi:peptide deformylase
MTLRKLSEYPAKVLNEVGDPVEVFDEELARLCDDMFETMYAEEGVGLAAPQIGLSLRLFVMDCAGIKLVAANPEIVATEGEQTGDEGCLSVGKIHAPLKRAERATLRAQDVRGEWYERDAEGLAARCFQHETDHCDGLLFINRLTPLKRNMVTKRFQKLKKWE